MIGIHTVFEPHNESIFKMILNHWIEWNSEVHIEVLYPLLKTV